MPAIVFSSSTYFFYQPLFLDIMQSSLLVKSQYRQTIVFQCFLFYILNTSWFVPFFDKIERERLCKENRVKLNFFRLTLCCTHITRKCFLLSAQNFFFKFIVYLISYTCTTLCLQNKVHKSYFFIVFFHCRFLQLFVSISYTRIIFSKSFSYFPTIQS